MVVFIVTYFVKICWRYNVYTRLIVLRALKKYLSHTSHISLFAWMHKLQNNNVNDMLETNFILFFVYICKFKVVNHLLSSRINESFLISNKFWKHEEGNKIDMTIKLVFELSMFVPLWSEYSNDSPSIMNYYAFQLVLKNVFMM